MGDGGGGTVDGTNGRRERAREGERGRVGATENNQVDISIQYSLPTTKDGWLMKLLRIAQ